MDNKQECSHGPNCFVPECKGGYSQQELQNMIKMQANTNTQQFQGGQQFPQMPFFNKHQDFHHPRHWEQMRHEGHGFQFPPMRHFGRGHGMGRWPGHHGMFQEGQRPPFPHQFSRRGGKGMCGRGKGHHFRGWRRERQQEQFETNDNNPPKQRRFRNYGSESSSSQSQSEQQNQFQSQNKIQRSEQALKYLVNKGFRNQNTNLALLSHFKNSVEQVQKCLDWCNTQQALNQLLSKYKKNLIILQYLGYLKDKRQLPVWKVFSYLEKSGNNLKITIEQLNRRIGDIERNNKIDKIVANCQFNHVQKIPPQSIFIIDGFNVVRTNKHLKKLTRSNQQKQKLQAILRLKTLVQTLASGHLVLDLKYLDDAAEKQIYQKIGVQLEGQKMIDVIYADKDKKADDKIVEILQQMTPQQKKKVLLVTGDRLLIKDCQQVVGKQMPVIGGKKFIKQCKTLMPKGFKNRIIRGLKKDKNL